MTLIAAPSTPQTVREEGVLALYKGVGPRLTRVCCEVGITMTLYAEALKWVERF